MEDVKILGILRGSFLSPLLFSHCVKIACQ